MSDALLDTNILVARGIDHEVTPDLSGFDDIQISSLTYAEMYIGLGITPDVDAYRERSQVLRSALSIWGDGIPFDDRCSRQMETVLADVRRAGRSHRSRQMDLMIAATAIAHGLTLVTRNVADFHGIHGLRLEKR